MNVTDIIKNKPFLAWCVKDPEKLSEESVLEHVLNYGDWNDVQTFIKILGIKKTNDLFNHTLKKKKVKLLTTNPLLFYSLF